jgi:HPt (histidine-containing phosphotransfer) domain-containing protein
MEDKLTKPVRIDELKAVLEATGTIRSPDRPSPTSGSDLPVCDERQLDELLRVDGGDGFVTNVFQLFIEQAEHLASRLPELADTPGVLVSEAHKLRGAARYAGAMRAAYFCGIVENVSESSQLDQSIS